MYKKKKKKENKTILLFCMKYQEYISVKLVRNEKSYNFISNLCVPPVTSC